LESSVEDEGFSGLFRRDGIKAVFSMSGLLIVGGKFERILKIRQVLTERFILLADFALENSSGE
jgi:hypothetical protein